jgi:Tfp pilus assembly protein PilX
MLITIISMLLMVISWLGMQAIYSSGLSYKSVEASQQMTQQFLIAEHALKMAEQWLEQTNLLPGAVVNCIQVPCILIAQSANFIPNQEMSWWSATNKAVVSIKMNLPQSHQAFYAIEQLMDENRQYYRITARGQLFTQTQPTILQSTWVKSATENNRLSWRRW